MKSAGGKGDPERESVFLKTSVVEMVKKKKIPKNNHTAKIQKYRIMRRKKQQKNNEVTEPCREIRKSDNVERS